MDQNGFHRLFSRHYADGPNAYKRFRQHLADANLGFDIETNCKEYEFPPRAEFPNGVTSFFYYYIAGSGFGSVTKAPATPEDPAHARISDGIGLNMGCPIRLARALNALFSLGPEIRMEPLSMLRSPTSHFSTVEELLWLTLWKRQRDVSRGGELVNATTGQNAKNIDWFFFADDVPIYLEAKFRPTDALRVADDGARTTSKKLFEDIGRKFPAEKPTFRKCIAAITGYAEPDKTFFSLCERKLLSNPGISVILYRSLLGPVYVCGLEAAAVREMATLILPPGDRDYPIGYPIIFDRRLKEQRRVRKQPDYEVTDARLILVCTVPDNGAIPKFGMEFPYRCKLSKRTAAGAPIFEDIPPFLDK